MKVMVRTYYCTCGAELPNKYECSEDDKCDDCGAEGGQHCLPTCSSCTYVDTPVDQPSEIDSFLYG